MSTIRFPRELSEIGLREELRLHEIFGVATIKWE